MAASYRLVRARLALQYHTLLGSGGLRSLRALEGKSNAEIREMMAAIYRQIQMGIWSGRLSGGTEMQINFREDDSL